MRLGLEIDPHERDLLATVSEARMPTIEQPPPLCLARRPRRAMARPPPTRRKDPMDRTRARVSERLIARVGEPDLPLSANELTRGIGQPLPEALRIEGA